MLKVVTFAMAENSGTLVVVESPAKAKTIGKYLGKGYTVKATVGHIRDLPERELGVDPERANLWGGAVAYGHPVGATGGRLIATILEILAEQDATTGCATLCIGGGQGVAMIVERL